jgi:putative transcriptional regulator
MIELRLEQLLKERGKTFYWLAKETGIGHASIWKLRHRHIKGITFAALEKICVALKCNVGDVLVLSERTVKRTEKIIE